MGDISSLSFFRAGSALGPVYQSLATSFVRLAADPEPAAGDTEVVCKIPATGKCLLVVDAFERGQTHVTSSVVNLGLDPERIKYGWNADLGAIAGRLIFEESSRFDADAISDAFYHLGRYARLLIAYAALDSNNAFGSQGKKNRLIASLNRARANIPEQIDEARDVIDNEAWMKYKIDVTKILTDTRGFGSQSYNPRIKQELLPTLKAYLLSLANTPEYVNFINSNIVDNAAILEGTYNAFPVVYKAVYDAMNPQNKDFLSQFNPEPRVNPSIEAVRTIQMIKKAMQDADLSLGEGDSRDYSVIAGLILREIMGLGDRGYVKLVRSIMTLIQLSP